MQPLNVRERKIFLLFGSMIVKRNFSRQNYHFFTTLQNLTLRLPFILQYIILYTYHYQHNIIYKRQGPGMGTMRSLDTGYWPDFCRGRNDV